MQQAFSSLNGRNVLALACSLSVLTFLQGASVLCAVFAHASVAWSEMLLGTTWRFLLLFRWFRQLVVLAHFHSQKPMANWHYYNEDGERVGAVTGRQLKKLAQNGIITPGTVVETEEGTTGLAKKWSV